MAQSRANTKVKESLRLKHISLVTKDDSSCDACPEESLTDNLQETYSESQFGDTNKERTQTRSRGSSSISLRSTNKGKADIQLIPDVGRTGSSPTTHSNMKTKQGSKEEPDRNIDDDTIIEPKTRARKKASDIEEEKKSTQDESKTSKDIKRQITKPKVVKKRPLGIRKTLRNKKPLVAKEKVVKQVIKQNVRRGRKTALKSEPQNPQETVSLIPVCDIKKEPIEETLINSRSSSPKTAGRRQRVSSDIAMMKTMLSDSPSSLVLGPRTSPYSMRSERSNSPSLFEGKNLRSGKPRKVKSNLLNEVVMNEQKKRRRLNSDSKTSDITDGVDDSKKLKRGRSCSRDGSEISKYSDNTESDMSMSETLNDTDGKELNKKLDKCKTDLDIDTDNNVQISTTEKVPCHKIDKTTKTKLDVEHSCIEKNKKKMSLNRSTSVDSDNNNCNSIKLENINTSEIEDKLLLKTDNNTLFEARSSILTSMSKTFNSKEVSKNIRKARRGRKVAAASRPTPNPANKNCITSSLTNDTDDKPESLESLSKEITDLINNLDENIIDDQNMVTELNVVDSTPEQIQTKIVPKALNKGDIPTPDTPIKGKENELIASNDNTPSKNEENENIRLHYEEDSIEKPTEGSKIEITYKCSSVASIDKLMDRLKVFEEFDKRRQRQELECKNNDKSVMVTNDVVLIPKSGDIKPLKDIQSVRSPEKRIEKQNLLSCFEHNSAISIVKRDQVRKSVDIDPSNSITLIKRNNSRKESTSSNPSRESDAISIFEKSLGKDVTLTEIRKSVDKPVPPTQVDLNQFATLHRNNPPSIVGVILDPSQISITARVIDGKIANEVQIFSKRKCTETSQKIPDTIHGEEKMATIEKIKTPTNPNMSAAVSVIPAPVAVKSAVSTPVESEALPATLENITALEDVAPEVSKMESIPTPVQEESKSDTLMEIAHDECKIAPHVIFEKLPEVNSEKVPQLIPQKETQVNTEKAPENNSEKETQASSVKEPQVNSVEALQKIAFQELTNPEIEKPNQTDKIETKETTPLDEIKTSTKEMTPQEEVERPLEEIKPQEKSVQVMKGVKPSKSARNSIESQAGPSNIIIETPESQKHKENVLRTLGLLTHKAAKELKEKQRICSGMNKHKSAKSGDYTGTLKTVIKLNRSGGDKDKKKHRSSLKMTFQKSKYRGKPTPDVGDLANEDDSYYTIERREIAATAVSDETEAAPEPPEPKETLNLVIPEKASSFSIHPRRLCMDQCFYCGGKFGLFDTPCHIGQMKSSERQKKVLENEEKLTVDSCLCDACYRHVDRRANCPYYRKRPLGKQPDALPPAPQNNIQAEKPVSPPLEEESGSESGGVVQSGGRVATCHTEACLAPADHSIRRKWLIKMRTSVNKVLKLKGDYPGLHTLPLCADHYRVLAPLMVCVLCGRRLTKHHNLHFINHGYMELNPQLTEAGVPVQFTERPVLCKSCRYYCTLLQRPGYNDNYALSYRRKLLQIYNIELPPELQNEAEESIQQDEMSKQKKKPRNKSKQRKSTEPDQIGSESSERTSESTPEKEKSKEEEPREPALEEDIESLISSNKILVPNATKTNESAKQSDGSEGENICDMDTPVISLDKQTELQYLLQKQNNPAQFMPKPNLTQKHKHIKLQTLSGIQKPGSHHRISDKNAKRIHKLGQIIVHKDKPRVEEDDNARDGIPVLKNISLNDECTIESIPNKRPADINTLKNKWQMSESFTQVKKNISELSKNKDHKKLPEVKYSNPVKRLETNPSISVRELFPGEEEMNLQCNVDFNNVKAVTPEGWEKCNSLIQYDRDTKKLWSELQRPYGNQSSFLRHLIILEKYFRNGDLVLSQNASPHAVNYSDSVQNRLRAFDNIVNDTPRRSEPSISLIEFRKKPSLNGKSLLKSNQNDMEKEIKQFMPPPIPVAKPKIKVDKARTKQMPPELIAINTTNAHGRKSIQNVLHNIQQLVKGVSASDPTEIAAAPLPIPTLEPPKDKKEGSKKEDTPKKSKVGSKPWRPRLMPITKENLIKTANEPPQQAVDGRLLPSLVQVMSAGKRYHITLQDYNKMCIIRRDKLQQLQEGNIKRQSTEDNTVITEIQPSAVLGNGGTLVQNITNTDKPQEKKEMPELQISSNAANILKNVGLKNITIAPIPLKTATVTSQTVSSPIVTSPSLLVTSNPLKIPHLGLGSAVSIVNDTNITPSTITNHMLMPKIPRSLTVIPQTMVASVPQNVMLAASSSASQPMTSDGPVP